MRRRKTDTLEGEPLVQLVSNSLRVVLRTLIIVIFSQLKKDQKVEELEFDLDEREVYDEAEKQAQIKICRYLKRGTIMKSMAHIFTRTSNVLRIRCGALADDADDRLPVILRLRQVTIHPGLIAEEGTGGSIDYAAELQRAREVMGEQAVYNLRKERLQVAIVMVRAERDGRELSLNEEISSECPIVRSRLSHSLSVLRTDNPSKVYGLDRSRQGRRHPVYSSLLSRWVELLGVIIGQGA